MSSSGIVEEILNLKNEIKKHIRVSNKVII